MERFDPMKMMNRNGTLEPSFDPLVLGKMKVETYNASTGTLTGYHCTKCRNRGSIAHLRDDGSISIGECSCIPVRRSVREMEKSGLKDFVQEKTFDTFQTEQPWQQDLKEKAQRYADDPQGWLLMAGQSGCGKTHLCTAVCRQLLLKGREVMYMPWRNEVSKLMALGLDEGRERQLRKFTLAQVLYIDDLYKTGKGYDGRSKPSRGEVSLAYEIINQRYMSRLPTIISTEFSPRELVNIDEATGGRILEMADSHTLIIQKDRQKNHRLRSIAPRKEQTPTAEQM